MRRSEFSEIELLVSHKIEWTANRLRTFIQSKVAHGLTHGWPPPQVIRSTGQLREAWQWPLPDIIHPHSPLSSSSQWTRSIWEFIASLRLSLHTHSHYNTHTHRERKKRWIRFSPPRYSVLFLFVLVFFFLFSGLLLVISSSSSSRPFNLQQRPLQNCRRHLRCSDFRLLVKTPTLFIYSCSKRKYKINPFWALGAHFSTDPTHTHTRLLSRRFFVDSPTRVSRRSLTLSRRKLEGRHSPWPSSVSETWSQQAFPSSNWHNHTSRYQLWFLFCN